MQSRTTAAQTRKRLMGTLRFKLIVGSSVLILISVVSLSVTFVQIQKRQIKSQLLKRGETVAALMAYNARYGVQIGDKPILDKIVGGIKNDADVVYCIITDKQAKPITSYNGERADAAKMGGPATGAETRHQEYRNGSGEDIMNLSTPVLLASEEEKKASDSDLEDALFSEGSGGSEAAPAPKQAGIDKSGGQRVIGMVQLGITLSTMKKDIAHSVRRTILFGALIFIVGFFLSFWIGALISAPIKRVVGLLRDISEGEGDLSQRIPIKANDETGDLAAGFNTFLDKFQEIKKISVFLNELADGGGDLTKRLNIGSRDEIGMLAQGFDRFTGKLHEIICQVAENTGRIAAASQTVSDTSVRLARELDDVAHDSTEVAQSSARISNGIEKTNENVTNVNELMTETEKASTGGVEVVHETRNGMEQITKTISASYDAVAKLNESSQKIGEIITTITEIADQTKLIAINAAIEASRVGAQGKGFGVVAEEIRRLAGRVTKATQDISQRIWAIQEESFQVADAMKKGRADAERGLELSHKSEESLGNISRAVAGAKSKTHQIAVASKEQTSSIAVISTSIKSISESAGQCSRGVTETSQLMQDLNKEVQALQRLVGQFVLDR